MLQLDPILKKLLFTSAIFPPVFVHDAAQTPSQLSSFRNLNFRLPLLLQLLTEKNRKRVLLCIHIEVKYKWLNLDQWNQITKYYSWVSILHLLINFRKLGRRYFLNLGDYSWLERNSKRSDRHFLTHAKMWQLLLFSLLFGADEMT